MQQIALEGPAKFAYHLLWVHGCLQELTHLVLSFHWELDNQLLRVLHSEHIGRFRLSFRELGRVGRREI